MEIKSEIYTYLPLQAKKIREDVFIIEQGFVNEFDEVDKRAVHCLVFADGVPAATGRAYADDSGSVYHIGRVAVLKKYRGLRLGAQVINALEQEIIKNRPDRIELSSQTQAKGFYERLGYTACSEEYMDEHCPHILMSKNIADLY